MPLDAGASRPAARREDRRRADVDRRRRPHLQRPARRGARGRRGADRRGLIGDGAAVSGHGRLQPLRRHRSRSATGTAISPTSSRPDAARRHLFALHAFNAEVARIRDVISEPMPGEIRLQWWRDAIVSGEGGGHPVATALNATIREVGAAARRLRQPAQGADLRPLRRPDAEPQRPRGLCRRDVVGADAARRDDRSPAAKTRRRRVAGHAGVAYALCGLMLVVAAPASRGQMFLPADLVAAHGVVREDVLAGKDSSGACRAAGRAAVGRAQTSRRGPRSAARSLPRALLPAFLPVALVEPRLRIMERPGYRPLAAVSDISPWRRQLDPMAGGAAGGLADGLGGRFDGRATEPGVEIGRARALSARFRATPFGSPRTPGCRAHRSAGRGRN